MNTIFSRIAGTGVLFLLIFLSGFWLSRSGKPYSPALFNIHKLIALGALVFLVVTLIRIHQTTPFQTLHVLAIGLTGLFFVATIVTGGLVSLEKEVPVILRQVHHFAPYLTVLSSAATLYLLLSQSSLSPV